VNWTDVVRERVLPLAGGMDHGGSRLVLAVAIAVALAAVLLQPVWRVVRLAVTLVHELAHAVVGLAVGRRFVGFVVRADMSGHTVTVGPGRGPGRAVSIWAGYPAPALVGAGLVWLAVHGWSAPVVTALVVGLLVALTRVRSVLTATVVALAAAGCGSLWWWRLDTLQEQVLVGAGLVLVVGGWRHVAAVARGGSPADDPAALAALTHVPRVVWVLSFVLVNAVSTWVVATQVVAAVRAS
jgi:hypothetical protein